MDQLSPVPFWLCALVFNSVLAHYFIEKMVRPPRPVFISIVYTVIHLTRFVSSVLLAVILVGNSIIYVVNATTIPWGLITVYLLSMLPPLSLIAVGVACAYYDRKNGHTSVTVSYTVAVIAGSLAAAAVTCVAFL